ncbi:methyl-accepting chemotaxis protein [Brevibacillus ginsengisoli]|uniref:methyl-accepting chemotaxis protein n=1 Tax=Brevibacillus ginsengisoli TaxID=363854 RepID=UPI003CF95659
MKFKSVKMRTLVIMLPIIIGMLVTVLGYAYVSVNSFMDEELKSNMSKELSAVSNSIQNKVTAHSRVVETNARVVESLSSKITLDQFHKMLSYGLSVNKGTYGLGIFYEPNRYDAKTKYFSTYAHRDNAKITTTEEYNDPSVDYPNQDWYKIATNTTESVVFSEPYTDDKLNVSMVTASVPFYDEQKKLLGVMTGDIDLTAIQQAISSIKLGETGWAFLLDHNGNYLATPETDKIMKTKITEDPNASIAKIGPELLQQEHGHAIFDDKQGKNQVFYQKIDGTNWVLALVMPEKELHAPLNALLTSLGLISIVGILIIGIVISFYSRYLTNQIKTVNELSLAMAQGDFTQTLTVRSADEFGQMAQNFNQMAFNVKALLSQIAASSHHVAATSEQLTASAEETSKATEQIANSIQEVAVGSDNQVRSVEQSTKAIVEMTSGIDQIAQNAQHVTETAQQALYMAEGGNQSIQTAMTQMNSISDHIGELSEIVQGLGTHSQQIGQILEVISGIADQTNLLALNAAIEAARAGEHGRGFAVVADEVRKLAEQSSQSAQKISHLITSIQVETTKAVDAMATSTKEVTSGIDIVNNAGESFQLIQDYVNQVAQRIAEVSDSARALSSHTQQVVESTNYIAQVADDTAAGTQNVSAASEEQLASMEEITSSAASLSHMAEELHGLISKFKV